MTTNESDNVTPQTDAVRLSSSLMASAKFIGHLCDAENALFMDCKRKNQNPSACISSGRVVTTCAERAIQLQENYCGTSFRNFTKCLENKANMFKRCKDEQAAHDNCVASDILPTLGRK